MKYQCLDCNHKFDEPTKYGEDRTPDGVFEGGSFIYRYLGCPMCSGAYDELQECNLCGNLYLDRDLYYHVCEECRENVESKNVEE